jgi:hypothetical protein
VFFENSLAYEFYASPDWDTPEQPNYNKFTAILNDSIQKGINPQENKKVLSEFLKKIKSKIKKLGE